MITREQRALSKALRALILTRQYVGEELLPCIEGWEWYDAALEISKILPHDDIWAEQFMENNNSTAQQLSSQTLIYSKLLREAEEASTHDIEHKMDVIEYYKYKWEMYLHKLVLSIRKEKENKQ